MILVLRRTTADAHPLIQKITGIIYGNALGDAFGLSTEFMDRATVNKLCGAEYDPASGVGAIPEAKRSRKG